MRINKYIAQSGLCSRREADKLIEKKAVFINGTCAELGTIVKDGDVVEVGKKVIQRQQEKIVLMFYKPQGVTCTKKDRFADKIIADYVDFSVPVTYAGRLDKNSEGLLLLTNDGDLIQTLMKGSGHYEKEYVVTVDKPIHAAFLQALCAGVFLTELKKTTKPCKAWKVGKDTFHIVLTQGLNRQIRRMCKEFGYEVVFLKRIRIANITLGDLKPGEYKEISEEIKIALG